MVTGLFFMKMGYDYIFKVSSRDLIRHAIFRFLSGTT